MAADFVLVGADEGELPAVRTAIDRLPPSARVRYDGPLPMGESVDRLACASVVVLPSQADTFPMVLLEAMSHGVPIICMRSCGLADEIEAAGAGLVVPDGDSDAAARALSRLLADPSLRERMGRAGRELVSARYSIAAIGDQLEQIYAAAPCQHRSAATQPGRGHA